MGSEMCIRDRFLSRNVSKITQIRDISALKELARAVGIDTYLCEVYQFTYNTTVLLYCSVVITATTMIPVGF